MAFDLSTRGPSSPTVFEQQREELVREIAVGMEQVLQNINQLNRNLESSIAVGNEFGSVEALWSQFEHFMGRSAEGQEEQEQGTGTGQSQGQGQDQGDHDEGKSQDVKYEEEEEGS